MTNQFTCKRSVKVVLAVSAMGLAAYYGSAQGVLAEDSAANYTSTGFTGNQGSGFGAWTLNTSGGGDYISGDTPPYFGIWNNTGNSESTATRSFNSALSAGETFSTQLMMNNLDSSANINALELEDSSGNVLFSYWQEGGDNNDGWYTDGSVTGGTATGFAYDYQQMDSFSFTLTSATTYQFSDLTTGASIDGVISGTVDQVAFLRGNESASSPSNGQDFKFNALEITSVPEPASLAVIALGASVLFVTRRKSRLL